MTAYGWRKRQIMQWVPNEKKEQPEEEPVCVAFIRTYVGKDEDGIEIWKEEPLYTAPPRREWVGLDDEDMKELRDANFDLLYGARWAERKLREKNGG